MEDLFKGYWWLLFPLAWFIGTGWQSWLNYRKHRDTLDIIRDYAKSGKEPPAGLLDKLTKAEPADDEWDGGSRRDRRRGEMGWYHVALFGALSAGFAYAAWSDTMGIREPFSIVAFVMGAVALAALVAVLTSRRSKG